MLLINEDFIRKIKYKMKCNNKNSRKITCKIIAAILISRKQEIIDLIYGTNCTNKASITHKFNKNSHISLLVNILLEDN